MVQECLPFEEERPPLSDEHHKNSTALISEFKVQSYYEREDHGVLRHPVRDHQLHHFYREDPSQGYRQKPS